MLDIPKKCILIVLLNCRLFCYRVWNLVQLYKNKKNKVFILSAGMPRSGSTLLFNIIRECAKENSTSVEWFWVDSYIRVKEANIVIVKSHTISWLDAVFFDKIIYSYRDLRTALVSNSKMFRKRITYHQAENFIKQYSNAKKYADCIIEYNDVIKSDDFIISKICDVLNFNADKSKIKNRLKSLNREGRDNLNMETFIHKDHRTYTELNEWASTVPDELRNRIEKDFEWWFAECGYDKK